MKRTKIVAEIGCNHCGDVEKAKRMISAARDCGADFVKFQKRDVSCMSEAQYNRCYEGPNSFGKTYGEHRRQLEFSETEFISLRDFALEAGIGFFATPFDINSLEFLMHDAKLDYIKFGSTQAHDKRMLDYMGGGDKKEVKLILSSGMMDFNTIAHLAEFLDVDVVMQTTSAYPCPEESVNLAVIPRLAEVCRAEVGLSGHYSSGNGAVEAAAVALGATWIERHFTLDRSWKGTDQAASLEPEGLRNVVKAVRTVERALGDGVKRVCGCERSTWEKVHASFC